MSKPFNLFDPVPVSAAQKERQTIAETLESIFHLLGNQVTPSNNAAHDLIDITQVVAKIIEDSEFEKSHRTVKTLLRRLVQQPALAGLFGPFGPSDEDCILITESGTVLHAEVTDEPGTYFSFEDVTDVTTSLSALKADIELLMKAAPLTGGIISSTEYVPLANWLRFHQLEVPKTTEQVSNLITLLKLALPSPPTYGNYWGTSNETNDATLAIAQDQHSIISQQIALVVNKDSARPEALINYLTDAILGDRPTTSLQEHPSESWDLLVNTAQAKAFAQACFEALHPEGSTADNTLTPHQRSELLVAAIMVDFGLADEHEQRFYQSFHLYHPRYVQASGSEIREKFIDIVVNSFFVHKTGAALALQLIFAGLAPEFLVSSPPSLQMGSPGWVMMRKSVMLAESIAPGLSRQMSYEQLMELGAVAPISPEQRTLHDMILTKCIIDWAEINGLDLDGADNLPTQRVVEHATTQYNAFISDLRDALKSITTPPVSRRALAKAAILESGSNPELKISSYSGGTDSLLDLYLARRLTAYNFQETEKLQSLEPANDLYVRQIDKQYPPYKAGIATILRLAMSRMRVEDRVPIEYGQLALYRVIKTRPLAPAGTLHRSATDVSSPFGVVMLTRFNDELRAFELFPQQGQCRENQALARQLNDVSIWLLQSPYDTDAIFKPQTHLSNALIDYQAYFKGSSLDNGSEPGASNILLEHFGQFDDMRHSATYSRSPMESFNARRFHDIGEHVAQHNPPMTYDQFYATGYDKTGIEQSNEKFERIFDTILNVIIPFKECIEGLASGNADRRSGALFSCVMDATMLLFVFVGAAGTFAKAAASSSRLLNLGKVSGQFALSLFNPLNGPSQLLIGGVELVGKSALKLGHYGLSVTRLGARQLRRLTTSSSGSYDLIKALSKSGAAAEIRMTLPTVAHARALFKDDTLETVEQIVGRLSDKSRHLPNDATHVELEHLFNNAVIASARKLQSAQELESLIGRAAFSDLFKTFMTNSHFSYTAARATRGTDYSQILEAMSKIEANNVKYMKNYQQAVLKQDLGKAPYDAVLPDSVFNPQGFTDSAQRAGAWIVHASTSKGNNLDDIVAVLREYASNGKSLTDPAVIKALHARVAPASADIVRVRFDGQPYASSISGFAAMKEHLKVLDATHEHFGKQLFGAVAGFHGLGDGNGRTARALYAISQLRANRFNATAPQVDKLLHGLP